MNLNWRIEFRDENDMPLYISTTHYSPISAIGEHVQLPPQGSYEVTGVTNNYRTSTHIIYCKALSIADKESS